MVKSVHRITRILNAIAESPDGLSNADIAKLLDLPKSTLSKLLASLTSNEWLSLDKPTKRYTLGPLLLFLGSRYLDNLELVRVGQRYLRKLTELTGEQASMEVSNGHEVVMVARILPPDARIANRDMHEEANRLAELGQRAPLYATAAGKCFLSHRTDEEIEQYLSKISFIPITPNTITDRDRLLLEIRESRRTGLTYNMKELNQNTFAIASPVYDMYGRVLASVVVVIPDFRFNTEKQALVEEQLLNVTREFSKQLGYHG